MKNVLIYPRVSTDEQAEKGFSLESQNEKLLNFCDKNGWNVVETFDEDYTAWKGFNRPAYNQLSSYIKKSKTKIDMVLFTQWSRFSRDYTHSVNEIKRLRDLGIEANAIEQWVDLSIPENHYLLAIYLTAPQVENERLSMRTIDGMRKAMKLGRWQGKAPYGYSNNKVTKLIEVDNKTAPLAKLSFEMMATGLYTAEHVRREMKGKGLLISKQGFLNMLKSILYMGKIIVPAFKSEACAVVKGLHTPIVSEEIFKEVHVVLMGKKKSYKGVTQNENIPLVGFIQCPQCNKIMTGSGSRGNGGIYHYYHCQRKYGCKNQFNAKKANTAFEDYLSSFQPRKELIHVYTSVLHDVFKSNGIDSEQQQITLKKEISRITDELNNAALKNVQGKLTDERYNAVEKMLEDKKAQYQIELSNLEKFEPEFNTYVTNSTLLISDLVNYYQSNDAETKKQIVGSIFPEKIIFENEQYRTTKTNEIITLLCSVDKGLNENCPAKNAEQSNQAPPAGLEPATL